MWVKMGLLKLTENLGDIDYHEYRDYNFYNKYIYRAKFYLLGARYAWYENNFDKFYERLQNSGYYGLRHTEKNEILKNLETLKKFFIWRDKHYKQPSNTMRVEGHTIGVYSNDLELLKSIRDSISGIDVRITEAKISSYVGVKHFSKKPKHNFRVYMKSKRVDKDFAASLKDLFKNSKSLYPSPALKFWANNASLDNRSWKYRWTSASHFIDYNDESTLSYLALVHGEILGKRYKLEKRPEQQ